MYTKDAETEKQAIPFSYYVVAVVAIALNVVIGIYPSLLTNLLQ
jgi:NADH-quinone oxidoreductase subunit N